MKPITEKINWHNPNIIIDLTENTIPQKKIEMLHSISFRLDKTVLRAMTIVQVSFKNILPPYVDVVCFVPEHKHIKHSHEPYDYRHTIIRKLINASAIKKEDTIEIDLQTNMDYNESSGWHRAHYIEWFAFDFGNQNANIEMQFQIFAKDKPFNEINEMQKDTTIQVLAF